jgi:CrcB protein
VLRDAALLTAITYLWVALGGALGSVARFGISGLAVRAFGTTFPWGTLIVNVAGSLAIGIAAGLTSTDGRALVAGDARAFVIVGVLGGFTTFSAFSLETFNLARSNGWFAAGTNVLASVAVCLVAVGLGYWLATALQR